MLLVAVGVFGALFYMNSQSPDENIPPSPPVGPLGGTGKTGATGKGSTATTGSTGATGATGETETAADRRRKREAALRKKAKEAGIPLAVYKARRAGKIVLILFWDPAGLDDRRTRQAVDFVDSKRGNVRVFRERLRYKSRYDGIAQAASVTRTPAVVLLYRGSADSFLGYIDGDTLNEKVDRLIRR